MLSGNVETLRNSLLMLVLFPREMGRTGKSELHQDNGNWTTEPRNFLVSSQGVMVST